MGFDSSEPREKKIVGHGRFLDLIDEGGWEYVRRHAASGVVVIVATTPEDELVLVEQFRVPVHKRVIELPAGLVGDHADSAGESLETGAERELEEETGFRATHWKMVAHGPSSVGLSAEMVTFFRATGLTRVGPGGGDETEAITVHVVPVSRVHAFIEEKAAAGLLIDPKVFSALYFATAAERAP